MLGLHVDPIVRWAGPEGPQGRGRCSGKEAPRAADATSVNSLTTSRLNNRSVYMLRPRNFRTSAISRAPRLPLAVQPRYDAREREPVPPLKAPLACAVVRARRLRVAVGAQGNYGVVGCIMAHPAFRKS